MANDTSHIALNALEIVGPGSVGSADPALDTRTWEGGPPMPVEAYLAPFVRARNPEHNMKAGL